MFVTQRKFQTTLNELTAARHDLGIAHRKIDRLEAENRQLKAGQQGRDARGHFLRKGVR